MSPLASLLERSTSVTLWSPAKGNRTTPFVLRGMFFLWSRYLYGNMLSFLYSFAASFSRLRPFGFFSLSMLWMKGPKKKRRLTPCSSKYPDGHPNELPHTHSKYSCAAPSVLGDILDYWSDSHGQSRRRKWNMWWRNAKWIDVVSQLKLLTW